MNGPKIVLGTWCRFQLASFAISYVERWCRKVRAGGGEMRPHSLAGDLLFRLSLQSLHAVHNRCTTGWCASQRNEKKDVEYGRATVPSTHARHSLIMWKHAHSPYRR